jgi:hypothetical protein
MVVSCLLERKDALPVVLHVDHGLFIKRRIVAAGAKRMHAQAMALLNAAGG